MKTVRYKNNPFINPIEIKTRGKRITVAPTRKNFSLLDHDTGEVTGVTFCAYKEVDSEEFIKIYTANVELLFNLKGAGKKVFQILLKAMQEYSINRDTIYLDDETGLEAAKAIDVKISRASFYRGVGDLIQSSIIAKSTRTNLYFINPHIIFNGDRVTFINDFKRKQTKTIVTK